MTDMMTILLAGVEDIARNMKEQAVKSPVNALSDRILERKVDMLTEKMDKLIEMCEQGQTDAQKSMKTGGKRMMDIKKRILDTIQQNPSGIRPPRIAELIGTRVQNLYPHLKSAVENKQINKDSSGTYTPAQKAGGKKKTR